MKGRLSRTSSTCSLIQTTVASVTDSDETCQPPPQQPLERDALELAWYSTVSAYSKLTSTTTAPTKAPTTEDRLAALSKAAELFSRKFRESLLLKPRPPYSCSPPQSSLYCAGLWPSLLPESLLWFAVYPAKRLPPASGPSWSWASLSGGHIYWDAQWPRDQTPWPLVQEAREVRHLSQKTLRFPRLDRKLQVLRARCLPAAAADPFGAVAKGVLRLRCCLCPALPVAAGPSIVEDSSRGFADGTFGSRVGARVWHGCIVYDQRMRKAAFAHGGAAAEMADGDWVATQLRAWEDVGWRNDHLKLLFDCGLSADEDAARKYEVLYCVKFYEYAPSSMAWGHHDGLLVRRRSGGAKNEFERVGLWKCTRASMFDDKYQVINLV